MRLSNQDLHDRIEALLIRLVGEEFKTINHKLDKIMANQADLDAAIAAAFADLQADLAAQSAAIDAAVQTIIDKIAAAGTPVDLQPEIDAINAATAASKASADAIAGQLPTTPTPPPTP